uniref:G_PROTEIN_RECEP_F1_2 domain-containing protein n=1 Tax=Steinernema glaseri TaxID=37863 RepID=A0A1I7Z4C5_9BILA
MNTLSVHYLNKRTQFLVYIESYPTVMEDSSVLPHCSPNDTFLHTTHVVPIAFRNQRFLIGSLYLFGWVIGFFPQCLCLYAICHKHHLKYSCYVLMMFVSVLDLCNLTTSFLVSGIFSVFNIQHCSHGYVVIVIGYITLWLWFAYCAAAMILALNRVLEFSSKSACHVLYHGKRCWLWILAIVGYASAVQCTVKKPFYFYNPTEGAFNFFTLNPDPTNINHVVNNLVKFLFVTISYAIMWVLLKIKMRQGGAMGSHISSLEAKLSIQALIVGVLAAFSTVGYLSMSYLPVKDIPFMGPLGEWLWASVHGGSAYIYLIMNKSIRMTALQLFCCSKSNVTTVTVTASPSSTNRITNK